MGEITGLDKIPEHMHEGVRAYILHGRHVGDFLTAIFSNNLALAVYRADPENLAAITGWVSFLHWEVPSPAWGSPEKVRAWQERGGLEGAA